MFTADELKNELKTLGVQVFNDMCGPVDLVVIDGVEKPILAMARKIQDTSNVLEIAEMIADEYRNFAFYQIRSDTTNDTSFIVRYAAWNVLE